MERTITVTKISDTIWQFNEANEMGPFVDAYLICGKERALVVDALQTLPNLYEKVRELTNLPLDLVITHGHLDHAGASVETFAKAGCKIYMDKKDYPALLERHVGNLEENWFSDAWDGMKLDLGEYCLEIVSVPGHTLGSLALIDRKNQLLFSGDTVGSGHFWMQIPTALPMNRFAMGLEKLYACTKPLQNLLIYPGHRAQSPVQLTGQYVKDIFTITKRLLSGAMHGESTSLDFGGRHMEFSHIGYGMVVDYCYDPQKLFGELPASPIEKLKDKFTHGVIIGGGNCMRYEFFTPILSEGKKYPLVIFLHGAGERGEESRLVLANTGGTTFAGDDWQKEHPCYVFAPQCPQGETWNKDSLQQLIAKAAVEFPREHPIDACRIYITGLSMGGMGTWAAISKYPTLFAAAMPICGAGDPYTVRNAKNTPVWAFHAEDDPVVPVSNRFMNPLHADYMYGTRKMVMSLRGTGNSNVHYTEYPTGYMNQIAHLNAHASWIPAYEDAEAKEWLFAQTRFDKYDIELIRPGLWYIEDFNNDSFYVVEGKERALVIDTGLGGGDFMGLIKSLTSLPISLAVTHVHGDHMLHSDKFGKFYMSKKEESLLPEFIATMMPESKTTAEDIIDIKDGDIIDLGGDVVIEVCELCGHTPGSVVFLDRTHNVCFTGDAFGIWMQVPGATSISEYKKSLQKFDQKLMGEGLENLFFLGGHRRQEGGKFPFGEEYRPNSHERVKELIVFCDKLLNDELEIKLFPMSFSEPAFVAEDGAISMPFTKSVLM